METKKPIYWMILFGIVRAALVYIGARLEAQGLIDAETKERIVSEGVTQTVGYLLIAAGIGWSALQKLQVWGWIKTALHLDAGTKPSEVPAASPGPDMPV